MKDHNRLFPGRSIQQALVVLADPLHSDFYDVAVRAARWSRDSGDKMFSLLKHGMYGAICDAIEKLPSMKSTRPQAVAAGLLAYLWWCIAMVLRPSTYSDLPGDLASLMKESELSFCKRSKDQKFPNEPLEVFDHALVRILVRVGLTNPEAVHPLEPMKFPWTSMTPEWLKTKGATTEELNEVARKYWTPRTTVMELVVQLTQFAEHDPYSNWVGAVGLPDMLTPAVVEWSLRSCISHQGYPIFFQFLILVGGGNWQRTLQTIVKSKLLEAALTCTNIFMGICLSKETDMKRVELLLQSLQFVYIYMFSCGGAAGEYDEDCREITCAYVTIPLVHLMDIVMKYMARHAKAFHHLPCNPNSSHTLRSSPQVTAWRFFESMLFYLDVLACDTTVGRRAVMETWQPLLWLELAATHQLPVRTQLALVLKGWAETEDDTPSCEAFDRAAFAEAIKQEAKARENAGELTALSTMLRAEDKDVRAIGLGATTRLLEDNSEGPPVRKELLHSLLHCCVQPDCVMRDCVVAIALMIDFTPRSQDAEFTEAFCQLMPAVLQRAGIFALLRPAAQALNALALLQQSPPAHLTRPQVLTLSKQCLWDIGKVVEEACGKGETSTEAACREGERTTEEAFRKGERFSEEQLWENVSKMTSHKMTGEQLAKLYLMMKSSPGQPDATLSYHSACKTDSKTDVFTGHSMLTAAVILCCEELELSGPQLRRLLLAGLDLIFLAHVNESPESSISRVVYVQMSNFILAASKFGWASEVDRLIYSLTTHDHVATALHRGMAAVEKVVMQPCETLCSTLLPLLHAILLRRPLEVPTVVTLLDNTAFWGNLDRLSTAYFSVGGDDDFGEAGACILADMRRIKQMLDASEALKQQDSTPPPGKHTVVILDGLQDREERQEEGREDCHGGLPSVSLRTEERSESREEVGVRGDVVDELTTNLAKAVFAETWPEFQRAVVKDCEHIRKSSSSGSSGGGGGGGIPDKGTASTSTCSSTNGEKGKDGGSNHSCVTAGQTWPSTAHQSSTCTLSASSDTRPANERSGSAAPATQLTAHTDDPGASSSSSSSMARKLPCIQAVPLPSCSQCGTSNTSMYLCAGCKAVRYCSQDCQRKHWRKHRKTCSATATSNA